MNISIGYKLLLMPIHSRSFTAIFFCNFEGRQLHNVSTQKAIEFFYSYKRSVDLNHWVLAGEA